MPVEGCRLTGDTGTLNLIHFAHVDDFLNRVLDLCRSPEDEDQGSNQAKSAALGIFRSCFLVMGTRGGPAINRQTHRCFLLNQVPFAQVGQRSSGSSGSSASQWGTDSQWSGSEMIYRVKRCVLVGGLEHSYFPIFWVANHPN